MLRAVKTECYVCCRQCLKSLLMEATFTGKLEATNWSACSRTTVVLLNRFSATIGTLDMTLRLNKVWHLITICQNLGLLAKLWMFTKQSSLQKFSKLDFEPFVEKGSNMWAGKFSKPTVCTGYTFLVFVSRKWFSDSTSLLSWVKDAAYSPEAGTEMDGPSEGGANKGGKN